MGLSNAPAVFQSAMNQIFGGLLNRCVCVYLDDILIFSKTEEELLQNLEQVLALLRKHDLKAEWPSASSSIPVTPRAVVIRDADVIRGVQGSTHAC